MSKDKITMDAFMDEQVKRAIDWDFILEKMRPLTPYGLEYKKALRPYPLGTEDYLRRDLDLLEIILSWDREQAKEALKLLHTVKDIRYSLRRAKGGNILSEVEIFEIKSLVYASQHLQKFLPEKARDDVKLTFVPLDELMDYLNPEGQNPQSFYLYDSYSDFLTKSRKRRSQLENEYRASLRSIRSKLKEEYDLALGGDLTITLPKDDKKALARAESAPYLTYNQETFHNVIFSLKPGAELLNLQEDIEKAKSKEFDATQRVLQEISQEIAKYDKKIKTNIHAIANLDLYLAKADLTRKIGGVKPEIIEEHRLELVEGRYPKIEENLKRENMSFTSISISLKEGVTCITGANMGGKTISLKLVGLVSVMAQMGLFVPARSLRLGLNAFVRTSIGDYQSTTSGLSTFGGEIENVTHAIARAHQRGLLLIDELARGTNPQEGYAISLAIVRFLRDKPAMTLLTTHFDKVTHLEGIKHLQVVGLANIDLEELEAHEGDPLRGINELMDYHLMEVSNLDEVPKDAIRIAHLMGLPREITSYAIDTLKNGW
ncbi:MAG: DNA mismatch repair protein MutS [Tissierellia bacterium]|nr:DNA mismatch repair protein MutS [Tissierellia bacterium]